MSQSHGPDGDELPAEWENTSFDPDDRELGYPGRSGAVYEPYEQADNDGVHLLPQDATISVDEAEDRIISIDKDHAVDLGEEEYAEYPEGVDVRGA